MTNTEPRPESVAPSFTPRKIAVILVVVAASVWVGLTALREPSLPDFEATGEPIDLPVEGSFPSVSLDEFEGILVGLRGQPVVVNIWASWCAPCRTEMPLLQDAADTYAGRAVILGLASKDDKVEAEKFLNELGLTYPNVFDSNGDARVALGLTAYPTTYVFGRDGEMRGKLLAVRSTASFDNQLLALVTRRP